MDNFPTCTIGVGSNSPDRRKQIDKAIAHVCELLIGAHVSDIYESKAFNGIDDNYLNAVIHGHSPLSATELTSFLKDWEAAQARSYDADSEGKHVVNIDLDLVVFDSRILRPVDFDRPYFNRGYSQLLADGAFQEEPV